MSDFTIRFGAAADAPALLALEMKHFPVVAGQPHSGFIYANPLTVQHFLNEEVARPRKVFHLVAERGGKLLGFAAAQPWATPGPGTITPANSLLQFIAVEPNERGNGIGSALLQTVEGLAASSRQDVIVAHVPVTAAAFYRKAGWTVQPAGTGFAWIPFMNHLHADTPDPLIGYPLMASKFLRPRAIRHSFTFRVDSGRPTFDAATELLGQIQAGEIDVNNLDTETQEFVKMAAAGAPPEGALDIIDRLSGKKMTR